MFFKAAKNTGQLSDRLPALQRDLFLNFHPQELPLNPVSRGGEQPESLSGPPRPAPSARAPPSLTSPSPTGSPRRSPPLPSLSPPLPLLRSLPRALAVRGAVRWGREAASAAAVAVSRGQRGGRGGGGAWREGAGRASAWSGPLLAPRRDRRASRLPTPRRPLAPSRAAGRVSPRWPGTA